MTIAQSILADNLDDNNVVIDESELMADCADACTDSTVWQDADGHTRGSYTFADGSKLNLNPCGPEAAY